MFNSNHASLATRMRAEISSFLTANIADPGVAWPRLVRFERTLKSEASSDDSVSGLRVLVVGELAAELPIDADVTKSSLLRTLRNSGSAARIRWRLRPMRVGGFVGRTVPVVAALGARVSVYTVVPTRLPTQLRDFFERLGIGADHLTATPGPCPLRICIYCLDGCVTIPIRSSRAAFRPALPRDPTGIDVILADPNDCAEPNELMRQISSLSQKAPDTLTVGIRDAEISHHNDKKDMHENRVWAFYRNATARMRLRCFVGQLDQLNDESLMKLLREKTQAAKVVLQLGPRGAMMLNGRTCPHHIHTCPVKGDEPARVGDAMLAVTTISSASGASDHTSLRRGVVAATGIKAGLERPNTLAELDVA